MIKKIITVGIVISAIIGFVTWFTKSVSKEINTMDFSGEGYEF